VQWLEELYQRNVAAVHHYCRRLLKDAEDSLDATQEVFLRAVASLNAPPDGAHARAWLLRVARNHCLDILRHRRRTATALARMHDGEPSGPSAESQVLNRQLVRTLLRGLAEKERAVLWQTEVEQRPLAEIARLLGVTYMAAAQVAYRARRRASLVAANLGGVFGVLGWRALRRRWESAGVLQPLAVLAVIPLVATITVATASGGFHSISPRPFDSRAPAHAPAGRPAALPAPAAAAAASAAPGAGPLRLRGIVPQPARDALHSVVQSAGQTIKQVTKPLPTITPLPSIKKLLPTPLPSPSLLPQQVT
jgi:RNA polymerase sigma-70 factor (ECF subfamily)